MKWLLDTNVVSELRKGHRANEQLMRWFGTLDVRQVYLSALVVGEIRAGLERVRPRDPAFAAALEVWLVQLQRGFAEQIWPVDVRVAQRWGQLHTGRTLAVVDGLLAATALEYGATLATRNQADVAATGVRWYDPFTATGAGY